MEILYQSRQTGKTTELIRRSADTEATIVCDLPSVVRNQKTAKSMGLQIPEPITYNEFINTQFRGKKIKSFLIDNVDILLSRMASGNKIDAITLSKDDEQAITYNTMFYRLEEKKDSLNILNISIGKASKILSYDNNSELVLSETKTIGHFVKSNFVFKKNLTSEELDGLYNLLYEKTYQTIDTNILLNDIEIYIEKFDETKETPFIVQACLSYQMGNNTLRTFILKLEDISPYIEIPFENIEKTMEES